MFTIGGDNSAQRGKIFSQRQRRKNFTIGGDNSARRGKIFSQRQRRKNFTIVLVIVKSISNLDFYLLNYICSGIITT